MHINDFQFFPSILTFFLDFLKVTTQYDARKSKGGNRRRGTGISEAGKHRHFLMPMHREKNNIIGKQTPLKRVIKKTLGGILLILGGWILVDGIYGPYYSYRAIVSAKVQGLPYSPMETALEYGKDLFILLVGIGIILGGAALWNQWRKILGLVFVAFGILYFFPEHPQIFTRGLAGCLVGCKVFGVIYVLLAIGLFLWERRRKKRLTSSGARELE